MTRLSIARRSTLLGLVAATLVWLALPSPGRATAPAGQYTNNGNGTVTDNRTGLIWQQTFPVTTYTHANAIAYCAGLSLGGSSNWRLPEISELQSLYDVCATTNPHVDTTYFPGTSATRFWSNTPYLLDTTQAWTLDNNSFHQAKTTANNVRCVR